MLKPQPTYEMRNDVELSSFLLGAIRDVRKNELDVERAQTIAQLADKYTRNQIMIMMKAKLNKDNSAFDLEAEMNKALKLKVFDRNNDAFNTEGTSE